ncbi:unnamed protein product, partial [Discosporangium mesarthrocarpum]
LSIGIKDTELPEDAGVGPGIWPGVQAGGKVGVLGGWSGPGSQAQWMGHTGVGAGGRRMLSRKALLQRRSMTRLHQSSETLLRKLEGLRLRKEEVAKARLSAMSSDHLNLCARTRSLTEHQRYT